MRSIIPKLLLVAFLISLLLGCSRAPLIFRLPNGEEIRQTTIREIEKEKKVKYGHYRGFIMEYKDSLFDEAWLKLRFNREYTGADVLSEEEIEKLRSKTFVSIEFHHILPDSSQKHRDPAFEAIIRKKYSDYDEEVALPDGFELRKQGDLYVRVEFYSTFIPNYQVEIFPTVE